MDERGAGGRDDEESSLDLDPSLTVCGNCMFWRRTHRDDRERWIGPCRVSPDRGDIPTTAAPCDRFMRKGSSLPQAPPPERTRRRSRVIDRTGTVLRRGKEGQEHGASPVSGRSSSFASAEYHRTLFDPNSEVLDMTQQELLDVLQEFFGAGPLPTLAKKYEGGRLLLEPRDQSLSAKEVTVDVFFKKLVRVRDQIRLLEQKINGHERLTGSEKVELQAYLTRCYGALTTFNVLFADAEDRFVGEKGAGS